MNRKRLVSVAVPLLLLVVSALACGPGGSKPTVSIIAPPNGSQIAVGQTVEVHFRAEDEQAVAWVQMVVNDSVVATQQSPLAAGQTPLEGILRWTPSAVGTFNLILTARNTTNQDSDPAAVSITVVEANASRPTPTPISTPVPQGPTPTRPSGQPTATTRPGQPTATTRPTQPASQPTATTRPTQPPTQPPPPTPVPPPEIVAFISDVDELHPGECVTFQWTTRNATEIYLDQWSVDVPAGQRIFCYDELGLGTNGFRLTAVNSVDSVFEDLYVEVLPPPETTISAPFVPGQSGSISADGRDLPFVSPGDDGSDIDYEAFMTFDIRGLPANGTITVAYLNLGTCSTNGDPAGLSDLHVVNLQYGSLDAGDYNAGGAYIASVDPCTIFSIDVTDRVEAMKAEVDFQVRLYFDGSDYDGDVDDVTYSGPTLDITYIIQ